MLKTVCVVIILMGCLNGADHFLSEDALQLLPREDHSMLRGYCLKDGVVKITSENLIETIVRLSVAKIRVGNTLDILRTATSPKFEENLHLLALGLSSWESHSCLLEEEGKALIALTTDLAILNRTYSTLFPSA